MEPNDETYADGRLPVLPFTLRHDFRPGDINRVMQLHGREFLAEHGFGMRFEGYIAEGLGKFALRYEAGRDRMWIAEDAAGSTLGTVTVARISATEAQLRWFIVDGSARRKGIGRALLREAIVFARSSGYHSLFLWTVEGLEAALHLYRDEGFELTDVKPNSDWATRPLTEQKYVQRL